MKLINLSTLIIVIVVVNAQNIINTDGDDIVENLLGTIVDLQSNNLRLQFTVLRLHDKPSELASQLVTELANLHENSLKIKESIRKLENNDVQHGEDASNIRGNSIEETTEREPTTNAHDCKQLYELGYTDDGMYTITINGSPVQVFCQDGGWTVIQKRSDDSIDYNRNMIDYAQGFGNVSGQHWLGLNTVHEMTSSGNWILRVDLKSFQNQTAWAEYSEFRVTSSPDYRLFFDIESYRGTAGTARVSRGRNPYQGRKFSTHDIDQDDWIEDSCVKYCGGGGLWCNQHNCGLITTTGMPYQSTYLSIMWYPWNKFKSLKSVTLRIIERS